MINLKQSKKIHKIIFLAIFLISFLPPIISVHAVTPGLPGLSVTGTNIVANGKPIRLRGVNMGDPFWARNPAWYPNYSLTDYGTLAQDWRANVARISIFPTEWKNMDHAVLLAGLSKEVNAALDNGLYVIISYHVIGWPDGFYQPAYPGNPADTYDSNMSVATAFWTAMAQTYGSDTRIIFDLWNEPVHDVNDYVGSDPNPLWPALKSYYESLIQTVRSNGGQNIVIATGNRWASWLVGIKDNPLGDSNVVYAYHKYSVNGLNTPTEWDKDTGGLISVKPVIVSEWGYEDTDVVSPTWQGSQASYGDPFTQWMEGHQLSNLAWMYHHDWTPALLKADGSLTLYGTFVKNYIQTRNSLIANSPSISGCPIFPTNNIWNTPIDSLPVDSHSSVWVNSIGSNTGLHMDFGSGTWNGGPIGIPYNISNNSTSKYTVSFLYSDESDPGPYPIPTNPNIEFGSDHHLLDLDQSTCKLYEMWDTRQNVDTTWSAGSGAIWDLNSNSLRPVGWTSADAAGLPILPGLVRYDEVASGHIDHAIRFTAASTNSYMWPARHLTSGSPDVLTSTPPMGARFRLKASFNISGYPAQIQVILQAMKTYGIILADNGSNWYISGAPDPQWDNTMLHLLDNVTGSNFEAVDSSVLMIDPDSGATSRIAISGNVGVAGVTLSYTDGMAKIATSQSDGSYSLPVSYNWGGRITPAHACYTFSPSSKSYGNVTANQPTQNYAPSLNLAAGCADVNVLIGGANQGRFGLTVHGSTRASLSGVNNGPVQIASTNAVNLIGAERVIYKVNGVNTSFSEMMALPNGGLDKTYWLPWYNNVDLDTQLRFANVSGSTATVHVYVNGVEMVGSPFTLAAGASTRQSFVGINNGPVKIVSDVNIVAAERVIYKVNGVNTSFSEMMALPNSQLNTTYWLPWYNNVDLDTQLRFANVSGSTATVHVYVHGVEMVGSPFTLVAGASTRQSFVGINNGPVQIVSDVNIVAAERVIYKVNGVNTSFSEMMALPNSALDLTYWLPWYNNVDLDTQLRFANVSGSTATVHVYVNGVEMVGSPFTLAVGASTRQSFVGINNGPVQIVSNVNIVAAERVIYKINGINTSFTEVMGLPNSALDISYWLPWYNNVDLDTQLRFGVP
jgi:uncharacterized protein YcfL